MGVPSEKAEHMRMELLQTAKELHRLIQRKRDSDPVQVEMLPGFEEGNHEVPCELVALADLILLYEKL